MIQLALFVLSMFFQAHISYAECSYSTGLEITEDTGDSEDDFMDHEVRQGHSDQIPVDGPQGDWKVNILQIHEPWDRMLLKHVDDKGNVDYASWLNEREALKTYLNTLSAQKPGPTDSEAARLAYWINLYNASTVDLILKNYPIKSIRDLNDGNPWDIRDISVGDQKYSLNEIEHGIIRKEFNEPRIHFAVNCAANSCPPLLNRAWTADNLEENLETMTKRFITDRSSNQLSPGRLKLSKIFEWYRDDFGNLIEFIQTYTDMTIRSNAKIEFISYDWSLNEA